MAEGNPKTFLAGAALVWRWQRLVWWIFILSMVLGSYATKRMVDRAEPTLDHSLQSAPRLVHSFDLTAIAELSNQPDSPLEGPGHAGLHFSVIYMVFMLFATGGILVAYYRDERPTTGAFFEACGYHFWRFFRLLLYFALALIPTAILASIVRAVYSRIAEKSISPMPSVYFFCAAAVVILFLLIVTRLWFDMAQVIAVAEDEKKMRRALKVSAGLLRRHFGSLFWLYFRISLIAWIIFGLGVYVWSHNLPPESTTTAFVLGQLVILSWIGTRLWQRASEALWYRKYRESAVVPPAYSPAPEPSPATYATAMN